MELILAGIAGAMIGATVATFVVAFVGAGKEVPEAYGEAWWRGYKQGTYDGHLPHKTASADEEGERLAQRFYQAAHKEA